MEREEILDIASGDNEDYVRVTKPEVYDQTRWSIFKSIVVKQLSTENTLKCGGVKVLRRIKKVKTNRVV